MLINKCDNVVYMTMTELEYKRLISRMEESLECLEMYFREGTKELKELYEEIQILKGRI